VGSLCVMLKPESVILNLVLNQVQDLGSESLQGRLVSASFFYVFKRP